jgi:hypothetical protein
MKSLDGSMKPVGAPRKKFTMPIIALADSSSSSQPLGMSRKEGCEYAHFRAGSDGLGQGNGQRQKSPSRCL